MPIYEFICQSCSHPFEAIVPNTVSTASCPSCKSQEVKKILSSFATHGSSSAGHAGSGDSTSCGCSSGACGAG